MIFRMSHSISIHPIPLWGLQNAKLRSQLRDAQMEAARVWNDISAHHREARVAGAQWPRRKELEPWTKGRYALHSQTVQAICKRFVANVEATMERRRKESHNRRWLRLPWREKRFQPLNWPAQAVSYDARAGLMVLPMGRGRPSIVLRGLSITADRIGAVTLIWNINSYELHVAVPDPAPAASPGPQRATVDLGIIHQGAVVDDLGNALVVSGRGIRSIKRDRDRELRRIHRNQTRCEKRSRRWRKLQKAKNRLRVRAERRVRDLRHKGTRLMIDWCVEHRVGEVFVGDPRGTRHRDSGRKQNRRTSQWECGKDMRYLEEKAKKAGIRCFNGGERGTSSHCPCCRHRRKVTGREWRCRACGFSGHRDVVGAVNMHRLAFDQEVTFPRRSDVTYLRPGPMRSAMPPRRAPASSISPGTGRARRNSAPRVAFPHPALSAPPDLPGDPRGAQALCRVSGQV